MKKIPIPRIPRILRSSSDVRVTQGTPWQYYIFWYCVRISLIVFAAICLWFVGRALMTPLPETDDTRREVADRGISQVVANLRANAGDLHRVELLHFENDPSSYVSDTLRGKLQEQGGFTLKKPRLRDKVAKLFGIVNDGCKSREDAVKVADRKDVDAVVWGRVDRLENERDGATFTGDYELYDLKRNSVAYKGKIAATTVPGKALPGGDVIPRAANYLSEGGAVAEMASYTPWYIRFLWFAVVTLLLPVFTISFIRMMVAKKSNRVNAFTLGVYTVVDLIFAFFMIGGRFNGLFSVLFFLVAGLVAFAYNVAFMSFALRLEGGETRV